VIDSPTQGVIVPFHEEGIELIAQLCAAYDLSANFHLLRKAQRYAVNLFQWELDSLTRSGAIYEAQKGTGVLCLQEGFYSDEFGLTLDGGGGMEATFA
jgi:CRISPR-associated endonuclease/helicase Cas3